MTKAERVARANRAAAASAKVRAKKANEHRRRTPETSSASPVEPLTFEQLAEMTEVKVGRLHGIVTQAGTKPREALAVNGISFAVWKTAKGE